MSATITSRDLHRQRCELMEKMRALVVKVHEEKRDFTSEENVNWEALNADEQRLKRDFDRLKALEDLPDPDEEETRRTPPERILRTTVESDEDRAEMSRAPTFEERNLAVQAWCLGGAAGWYADRITPRHKKAVKICGLNMRSKAFQINLTRWRGKIPNTVPEFEKRSGGLESRALTTQTGSSGKFSIPEGFVPDIEMALLDYEGVRQVCKIMRTDSGNDLPWPNSNDTGNLAASRAENTAVATNVDPVLSRITLKAYKYDSNMILVPTELLDDTGVDIVAWLSEQIGQRIARRMNEKLTVGLGSGSSEPQGVVTAATLGKTAASTTAFTYGELIDLIHSVNRSYRKRGGFLMMHDAILAACRKLVDSNGQPIFATNVAQAAFPETICGEKYVTNAHMTSAMTTGQKVMLYGDFSTYLLREVRGIRFRRLDERYADTDQVGFIAFVRFDGQLQNAGTNPLKYLALA